MTTTVAEVLNRAADLIETRGLAHGTYQAPDGTLCARGAIRVVVFGTTNWPGRGDADETLYYNACSRLRIGLKEPITMWNDSHTQADVVSALRAAAARQVTS